MISSSSEKSSSGKYIDDDTLKAKARASMELDNIVDAGKIPIDVLDGKDGQVHANAVGGFTWLDTIFKIGKLFKDVTQLKNITDDIYSSYGKNPKSIFIRDTSMEEKMSSIDSNVIMSDTARQEENSGNRYSERTDSSMNSAIETAIGKSTEILQKDIENPKTFISS